MSKNRALCFEKRGWEDYIYWQKQDKKTLQKINSLIEEILKTPFIGTGKPEALKADFTGLWSRRINESDRLVYAVQDDKIIVAQCRYHYSKQ